mmetsp:Transcript_11665/g.34505  ORF Transcript_11665/g.34505 Transcript_11665/m.34505 type:complete len:202 (-) Transcript_11665:145-750(-)
MHAFDILLAVPTAAAYRLLRPQPPPAACRLPLTAAACCPPRPQPLLAASRTPPDATAACPQRRRWRLLMLVASAAAGFVAGDCCLPPAACRLPPAASTCRLPPAAYRLSPAACRLSLVAAAACRQFRLRCRLSLSVADLQAASTADGKRPRPHCPPARSTACSQASPCGLYVVARACRPSCPQYCLPACLFTCLCACLQTA